MIHHCKQSLRSDCGHQTAQGDSKGGTPFAYWDFLVVVQRERKEKSLIGYGFFKSPLGTHESLGSETFEGFPFDFRFRLLFLLYLPGRNKILVQVFIVCILC